MKLIATDNPAPCPNPRYDYAAIAAAAEQLEENTGLSVVPCPTNITLFRRTLRNYISTDRYEIFTREGVCWIVREAPKGM